jgi:hypothetical protein
MKIDELEYLEQSYVSGGLSPKTFPIQPLIEELRKNFLRNFYRFIFFTCSKP